MLVKRCLVESGGYRYGSTQLKSGRCVPYIVRFPKPLSERAREALVENCKEKLPWAQWPKNLAVFGIAKSGLPLARLVADGLEQVGLSIQRGVLDPHDKAASIQRKRKKQAIIVDNAVTTGASIRWAHQLLQGNGYRSIAAVRFFTREEVEEDGLSQEELMLREIRMNLLSLFSVRDLLSNISDAERHEILNNLVLYGTSSVRKYMEEAYVFRNETWLAR